MKIEKMNDHQIRCTLTSEDLATRNIKLRDRKSTRLNSSHIEESRMPSSA